ncbi:MAG: TolC family outer membrane protein [Gammaproteobacteria bacterium]
MDWTVQSRGSMTLTRLLCAATIVLAFAIPAARAETLDQALAYAYQHNPLLRAARASQTAAESDVRAAEGGWYPQLGLTGGVSRDNETGEITFFPQPTEFDADLNQSRIALRVEQPLYQGGRVSSDVAANKNNASAAHADTRAEEANVLLAAVQAYLGVVTAQAVLKVQNENVEVLGRQVKAAKQSLAYGEGTRTDVAQAQSRLQGAIAARIQANAALAESRARYQAIIGREPGALTLPNIVPALPVSLDQAETLATQNYSVVAARFAAMAAADQADAAHNALYPEVGLYAEINRQVNPQYGFSNLTDRVVGVDVSIPIWEGGSLRARSAAAQARADSASLQARSVEDQARAEAAGAWQDYAAAHSAIDAIRAQLDAARIAYDGVDAEHRHGERTLLDVLNAAQEVRNAEVALVRAQRDDILAGYALLATTGGLSGAALHLPVANATGSSP